LIRNTGRIYENIVAIELKRILSDNKELEFFYWRTGDNKEIDFVIKKGLNIFQII